MHPWNPENAGNGQPGTTIQTYTLQPVAIQPVPPVPPQSVPEPTQAPAAQVDEVGLRLQQELFIYSHSTLFYWWPVWVVGYVMTALTWLNGQAVEVGGFRIWFHPNGSLGVMFFAIVFLVILITNVSVRGLASALVIVTALFLTVLFAFFGWWDTILGWLGALRIHLNLGAYFWFSTLMFAVWVLAVFIFDRFTFWRVRPGQITQEHLIGTATQTYDTKNMMLEKYRDDVFRHWVLGLGSGDLRLKPFGARRDDIEIPNVLFVGTKIEQIMRLIRTESAEVT